MKTVTANFNLFPEYNPSALGLDPDRSKLQKLKLGDASCNSVLVLWVLLTAGMAKMDEAKYLAFVDLYKKINENNSLAAKEIKGGKPGKTTKIIDYNKIIPLTEDQELLLDDIVSSIILFDANILLCLYGDELTDRLGSDRLMIALLNVLAQGAVRLKILGSNHLHFFATNFLLGAKYGDLELLKFNGQGVSFLHLLKCIEAGTVQQGKIHSQVINIYKNGRLDLVDFTLHEECDMTISLGAHAPFDLQRILDVANYYKLPIPEMFNNASELAVFIDKINAEFKKAYVDVYFTDKGELPELIDDKTDDDSEEDYYTDPYGDASNPVGALFWEKNYLKVNRPTPECFKNINCFLYNGHTDAEKNPSMANRFSLNSHHDQKDDHYEFPVQIEKIVEPVLRKELKLNGLPNFFQVLKETPNTSGRSTPITPVSFQYQQQNSI